MESSSLPRSAAEIDFILRRVFKLDPEDVRDALRRVWRTRFGLREDEDMPSALVNHLPARNRGRLVGVKDGRRAGPA